MKPLSDKVKSDLFDFIYKGGEFTSEIYGLICDTWAGEIPYGVLKGRDGTVDEWISERMDELEYMFKDELDAEKKRRP